MAQIPLCTTADVYRRIGGQAALAQLIDPDGTGTWDQTTLDLAILDATNMVVMASGVQNMLAETTQADFARHFPELVTLTAQKALGLVWTYGTAGRAMPPGIEAINKMADDELDRLRSRRAKSGAMDYSPQPAHRIESVDNDPNKTRITLASWKTGWC